MSWSLPYPNNPPYIQPNEKKNTPLFNNGEGKTSILILACGVLSETLHPRRPTWILPMLSGFCTLD